MLRWWINKLPGQEIRRVAVQAENPKQAKQLITDATGVNMYQTDVHGVIPAPPDIEDYLETEHLMVYFQVPAQGLEFKMPYIRHKVPGGWVYVYLNDAYEAATSVFVPLPEVCYEKL